MALSFSFKRGKVQSLTSGVQQSRAQEGFPNVFNSAKDDKVLARAQNKITVSVPQFIFQDKTPEKPTLQKWQILVKFLATVIIKW